MEIKSVKEQYRIFDELLKKRIDTLMPKLMKETGIDLWLVLDREYNEDPVFSTLVPKLVKNVSRQGLLAFSLMPDGTFEALSLSRPNSRLWDHYNQAYNPKEETQCEALRNLLEQKNPSTIGINISEECPMCDGLSKTMYDELMDCLGETYAPRTISAEKLCTRWLETRIPEEIEYYKTDIYPIAVQVMDEAFSSKCIVPGKTTTADLEWYMMQRFEEFGLGAWFAPDVDSQRKGESDERMVGQVIQPGDLIHCDMGTTYLGLRTDSQRMAYISVNGEDAPEGIQKAFETCNRFQDIVRASFKTGLTGNEIFEKAIARARAEGIEAMLYSHPIGFYGHGAGPIIGLYDHQGFVEGRGEVTLHDDTCYALELNIRQYVPEWDQKVCIMLEETVAYTGGEVQFLDPVGRTKLMVVK